MEWPLGVVWGDVSGGAGCLGQSHFVESLKIWTREEGACRVLKWCVFVCVVGWFVVKMNASTARLNEGMDEVRYALVG